MRTIVVVMAIAAIALLMSIVQYVQWVTFALTDNNTDAVTRGGGNDSGQYS